MMVTLAPLRHEEAVRHLQRAHARLAALRRQGASQREIRVVEACADGWQAQIDRLERGTQWPGQARRFGKLSTENGG